MNVVVAVSQVSDGTMHNAKEPLSDTIYNNRKKWFAKLGLELQNVSRVVSTYDKTNFCMYREQSIEQSLSGRDIAKGDSADALVTRDAGHILFLPVADCIAATLYDKKQGILMLSHLGRHSLEQDGGYKSVRHLIDTYGSDPRDIYLWLSPAPRKEAYPIHSLQGMGMKEAVFQQLLRAGILDDHITDNDADTVQDTRYYSHSAYKRGEKAEDGRYAMIAYIQE